MNIEVPISLGELVDKITILQIKRLEITNESKLKNINYEYQLLDNVLVETNIKDELKPLSDELMSINRKIWDLEDVRRKCENDKDFGEIFLDAVRQIHINNEERSRVKRIINTTYGSDIVEEKSYTE
jgi:hypothetical protein